MTEASKRGLDFLVDKQDWSRSQFVSTPKPPDLLQGEVLFRVDRFALTANNISYAFAGDLLGYWRFFPTEEGWGRIPTMGFGDVIASRHPEVATGTRCFGFFPISRYLVIEPGQASEQRIVEGAAHRAGLAPAYNEYSPVKADPLYREDREDAHMLLRGLFMTSFLAEDFLFDRDLFGAEVILISSASSKTSIALAHQVSKRGRARAVGLTSARNLDFVSSLGCYDRVLGYEEIESLDAGLPSVFVDMAGNGKVNAVLHGHFRDQLKYDCSIGATHWDAPRSDEGLPGPKAEFFFAPSQVQKRAQDWGAGVLQERLGAAWSEFRDWSSQWLRVQRGDGRDCVERVYLDTLAGRTQPADGHVLSLWDAEEDG